MGQELKWNGEAVDGEIDRKAAADGRSWKGEGSRANNGRCCGAEVGKRSRHFSACVLPDFKIIHFCCVHTPDEFASHRHRVCWQECVSETVTVSTVRILVKSRFQLWDHGYSHQNPYSRSPVRAQKAHHVASLPPLRPARMSNAHTRQRIICGN